MQLIDSSQEIKDIIPDCTNINLSKLEMLYSRMDLFDTIVNAYEVIEMGRTINDGSCDWINSRICTESHRAAIKDAL